MLVCSNGMQVCSNGMQVSPSRASPEAKHFTRDISLSFSTHCSGLVAPMSSLLHVSWAGTNLERLT